MDYFAMQAEADKRPLEARIMQAEREYADRRNRLTTERDRALREAYVARMMAERELPDRLASSGYYGGLAETSELDLRNSYLRNRRNLERDYSSRIGDLELAEAGEMEDLRAKIAAAEMAANARRAEEEAAKARELEQFNRQMALEQARFERELELLRQRSSRSGSGGSGGTYTKKEPYDFGFDNYYPGGVPQGVDYLEYNLIPYGEAELKATQLEKIGGRDMALGYLDNARKENRLDRRVYDRVKNHIR